MTYRAEGLATAELCTLEIHNHDIAAVFVVQDVAWLCIAVEHTLFVHCLEDRGDCIENGRLGKATAVKQGPSSPTKKHRVQIDSAVVIIWQDQVDTAETYGDVLPLDGPELVVDLVLVLQAGTVETFHALGNKRITVGGQAHLEE
jgi:hypothetical protein